jgi:succinyl-CoA synthetase beta subunit
MKIHEYQAKTILSRYGVPVPTGEVARDPAEARNIAARLGGQVVVKAQIHAGGRGKGGGVRVASGPDEAESIAREMIGMRLVTHQTGPEGRVVERVLIEQGVDIRDELYLGVVIDREAGMPVLMASGAGGMDIEEVARDRPDEILKQWVLPGLGLLDFQSRKLAFALGLRSTLAADAAAFMSSLYEAFRETDASLVEINPFIVTGDGALLALDAKMNFDDNALFRHPDVRDLRDLNEEEPLEIEASKYGLNYIRLDGNIACMVNGAGLAMATMDIIKLAGGEPANFLDVGGGASAEQVENAFRILLSDANVKAVLINIFGGIMRCDVVASGVVEAARKIGVSVPVVVRLEGTNVEQGQAILRESGLNFLVASGMKDAADQVVQAAGGSGGGTRT